MCTALLPPGVNPIVDSRYINIYILEPDTNCALLGNIWQFYLPINFQCRYQSHNQHQRSSIIVYSCYNELYLVQISGLWVHLGTIKHNMSLSATSALTALVTLLQTELVHKAATVTFNNAHIARAINTTCRLMKTKRKRMKIPSSALSAYDEMKD